MHVHALAHTHVIGAARQHAAAPACWTAADSPGRTGRAARTSASGPPDAMPHRSMHAHAALCTGPTCLWSNNGPRPAPEGPAPTGRRPQPQHTPRLTHRGRAWEGPEKFREKFRETSSTPPPSAHNRPQADLILVLGRDLVREDFQSVPELTVHFCIGRCTLALPAFPAGPDSLYCSWPNRGARNNHNNMHPFHGNTKIWYQLPVKRLFKFRHLSHVRVRGDQNSALTRAFQ